ncbi:MAG: energy transducer TonB [Sulfuricella sp.]|nr:energy transducer TonB [Sulfuricella sp.]
MRADRFDLPEIPSHQARLILTVTLSLACHLALLFLVKVLPAPRPPVQVKVLQVELGERIRPAGQVAGVVLDSPRALRQVDRPVLRELQESSPDRDQGTLSKPAATELDTPQPPPPKSTLLPALDMALVEDPTYYTAKQVDVHPQAAQPIRPEFPDAAADAKVEGYVVLKLLIEDSGAVREVAVVEGNPPGVFDEAALQSFRNARFIPAQRNGRLVKSQMLVKVTFELVKPEKK